MISLSKQNIVVIDNDRMIVKLPLAKTVTRVGQAQNVLVTDPLVVWLYKAWRNHSKRDRIYSSNQTQFGTHFKETFGAIGLRGMTITGNAMRRGAATNLFIASSSYDIVAARGRWNHVQTAKVYIEEAVAELSERDMSERNQALADSLCAFAPRLPEAFERNLLSCD